MNRTLEVLFTPAEFNALTTRDLGRAVCVVFDVLRATSVIVQALNQGASGIIPVGTIEEALTLYRQKPDLLLAGERHGLRITGAQSGFTDFHFGNSPREFKREAIDGKTIVTTTTNGTRALRACQGASEILVASFLNLDAVAGRLAREDERSIVVVCSGTEENASYEDTLAAGALCERLLEGKFSGDVIDSAAIAQAAYRQEQHDLMAAMGRARNGARLLGMAELKEDVAFCLRRNAVPLIAVMDQDGVVRSMD